MDYIQITGLLAAILTTGANIPQAIKVIKTRSTKSLSAATYSMLFFGMILWVIYGVIKKDIPIILANAVAGSLCGIILFMKLIAIYHAKKSG
ncbi:SemiSWEET family sugar transporter [Flavobacterium beibuense]|uniref:MtN3 and saliva related transmembrane protein n=1 Tax=Flavobacterium beibuense TaxID=657326 RepID=A0A444W876_9FLAO|nr:SemiSWEET transporter [Flavobacterium beibuense]RYJ42107.1 MtN3 and saliva related transmembrane protein [Flavobacterium beibuense]